MGKTNESIENGKQKILEKIVRSCLFQFSPEPTEYKHFASFIHLRCTQQPSKNRTRRKLAQANSGTTGQKGKTNVIRGADKNETNTIRDTASDSKQGTHEKTSNNRSYGLRFRCDILKSHLDAI